MGAGVIAKTACTSCRPTYKKIDTSINLPALSEVFSRLEGVSILGGNEAEGVANRFSYWTSEPLEIFEFKAGDEKPFEKLEHALAKYKLENDKGRDCRASLAMTASFRPHPAHFARPPLLTKERGPGGEVKKPL